LSVNIDKIKRNFYTSCNNILHYANTYNDMLKLFLCETYCLPILLYAMNALRLNSIQTRQLNVCWNTVVRRIFGYNTWESVRGLLMQMSKLDFIHMVLFRQCKFCKLNIDSSNSVFRSLLMNYINSARFKINLVKLKIDNLCGIDERVSFLKDNSVSRYHNFVTSVFAAWSLNINKFFMPIYWLLLSHFCMQCLIWVCFWLLSFPFAVLFVLHFCHSVWRIKVNIY
jgi:hypothetical protein